MKSLTKYQAEDGRTFDSKAECAAHELAHGWTGPVAEHLDARGLTGQSRSIARNAISKYLIWFGVIYSEPVDEPDEAKAAD